MKHFLPAIVWAFVILLFSTKIGIQLPKSLLAPDKLGHFVAYSVFSWLVLLGFHFRNSLTKRSALLAVLIVTSYGVGMEFAQWAFFPNRFFEVWDMVANTIGAVLGYIAFYFYFTKK